jgi:hypothetical protein
VVAGVRYPFPRRAPSEPNIPSHLAPRLGRAQSSFSRSFTSSALFVPAPRAACIRHLFMCPHSSCRRMVLVWVSASGIGVGSEQVSKHATLPARKSSPHTVPPFPHHQDTLKHMHGVNDPQGGAGRRVKEARVGYRHQYHPSPVPPDTSTTRHDIHNHTNTTTSAPPRHHTPTRHMQGIGVCCGKGCCWCRLARSLSASCLLPL